MADWVCLQYGCTWRVNAPPKPPVHVRAGATDPNCPLHRTPMTYTPGPEDQTIAIPAAGQLMNSPGFTLTHDLKVSYNIKEQPDIRREVAGVMGIADKGHKTHGSNFTSAQTLKQIIDNLFLTVAGNNRQDVVNKVVAKYKYNPETMMVA